MSDVVQGARGESEVAEANRLNLAARKALRDDPRAALAAADDAHVHAERAGYAAGRAQALRTIGECRFRLGDREGARKALEVASHILADRGDLVGEADAQCALGAVEAADGRLREAVERLGRALALARAGGSRLVEADARHCIARTLLAAGVPDPAADLLHDVIAARRILGDRRSEALALSDLAGAREDTGERESAAATLLEAIAAHEEVGERTPATRARARRALLLADLGELAEAEAECALAAATMEAQEELAISGLCLQCAGAISAARGDQVAAQRAHQEAAGFFRRLGDGAGEARAMYRSALTRLRGGDTAGAVAELTSVSALAGAVGADVLRLEAHRAAVVALESSGDQATALTHLRLAATLEIDLERRRAELTRAAQVAELRGQMEVREAELDRLRLVDLATAHAELEVARTEARERNEHATAQQLELDRLARIDAATGLANRFYFQGTLDARFEAARDAGLELALAIVDVDHFRLVNEISRSYRVGDDVLRAMAQILGAASRDVDLTCRWAGEEFAVLFPRTERAAAVAACERIRERVEEHDWATIHPSIRVSVSIGLAGSGEATSADELMLLAETRAAQAMNEGRNQVSW